MATTINLRDYYYWYAYDVFIEIPDDVAVELQADIRYEKAFQRRTFYNKGHFSLDVEDGIEASAITCHSDNPEAVLDMMENHCRLCRALNSLPENQGRRVDARYLQGMSILAIASAEGVSESAVKQSIIRGLKAMRKNF